jgi:FHA domain
MSGHGSPDAAPREAVVQLLDPTYRRPVKTWKFVGKSPITIGREAGRDVEISDPYVSRLHAELVWRDNTWILVSKGRNGVVVGSRTITELPLSEQTMFRLGAAGPALRFCLADELEEHSATLCFDTETIPVCLVDQSKLREDVGQITSGEYFQKLQQQAETLRRERGRST